jgi:preprotein translocase subunit SecG
MGFIIGLLTLVMVLDCAVLIFLVLIQLPKKEAGAGLAFGGAATDALFGAGKGNVLTNVTKYTAAIFFVLALVLSLMQRAYHGSSRFEQMVNQPGNPSQGAQMPPSTAPGGPSAPSAVPPTTSSNAAAPLQITPEVSNAPAPSAGAAPAPAPAVPAPTPPAAADTNPAAK